MKSFVLWMLTFVMLVGLTNGQRKYCCSIDQWEGAQSTTYGRVAQGVGSLTKTSAYIYNDVANHRVAGFFNMTSDGTRLETFVLDVTTSSGRKLYTQDLQTKICDVEVTSEPFMRWCEPENVTPVNLNNAALYHFKEDVPGVRREIIYTFTTDGQCIPVKYHLISATESGGLEMIIMKFTNSKPGISQPSLFKVPPECEGVQEVERNRRMTTGTALSFMNSVFPPL